MQQGLQQKHRGNENKWNICVVPYCSALRKTEKEKAQPCLESAVDFCAQAMQELSYWFGLSSWQDPYLSTAKFVQENPGSMDWHFSLLANLQLRNFHCCTSHPHPDPKY